MEMKIYIANLGAYNDGELRAVWVDLPITDMKEEVYNKIFSPEELDENGNPHGDFAIHDYELPFEISEQENLDVLNDIVDTLYNKVDSRTLDNILIGHYDVYDVLDLASSLGLEDSVNDFVHRTQVINEIEEDAISGELVSIKYKLAGIETVGDDEFYFEDGYGNYHTISNEDLRLAVDQIFKDLKHDCTPTRKISA